MRVSLLRWKQWETEAASLLRVSQQVGETTLNPALLPLREKGCSP